MPDRIILINKPLHWTSFDVVKKLRKPLLEERRREEIDQSNKIKNYKVGHAGTLDPLATGLLILCTGKLTKKISSIQDAEKEYTGTITLGAITDSFDLETVPHSHKSYEHIKTENIIAAAEKLTGELMQSPPIHSAKKIGGQRAYEKARKGEQFEISTNKVFIYSFEITEVRLPEIDFRIVCSKGTYIRSIANDLGQSLGTGGHLSTLCRTRIGDYLLTDALSPIDFLGQLSQDQPFQKS